MEIINYTHGGYHFAIYTDVKSLCCSPKTNTVCQLHLDKKIKD